MREALHLLIGDVVEKVFAIVAVYSGDALEDGVYEFFASEKEARSRFGHVCNLSEYEGHTLYLFESFVQESEWNRVEFGYDLGDFLDMRFEDVFDTNNPIEVFEVGWF